MPRPRPARSRRLTVAALALTALVVPAALVVGAPAANAGTACDTPLPQGDCTAPTARIYSKKASPSGGVNLDEGDETTSDFAEFYISTTQLDPDRYRVTYSCHLERDGTVVGQEWEDCTIPPDPRCGESPEPESCDYSRGNIEYTGLLPGTYTFLVRAKDAATNLLGGPAENEQGVPSSFSWTVVEATDDTAPPSTVLTSTPNRWHLSPFVAEEYDANEPLKDAVCRLQGALVSGCDRSQAVMRVSAGDWTFAVAGIDFAGNQDPSPAVNRFSVPVPSSKLRASSGWRRGTQFGYFFDGYSTTKRKGASLSAARAGTRSVVLVATRCPGCGTVTVTYGSTVLKRISLASSTTRKRQLIPVVSWTRSHGGQVKVTVTSSGKPVTIEGLGFSERP